MSKLKILLFLAGLIINSIVSSAQSSDSLYHLPIQSARKLVKLAMQAKVCDTLVQYQELEINRGLRLQAASDSLLEVRKREIALSDEQLDKWRTRYANQVALTKIERKRKNKWMWVAIGVGALGIFVAVD